MPTTCTDPVSFGSNGLATSYWRSSPVPQQETYKKRSSRERLISVMRGGTALNPCNIGGSKPGSAGSAGTSMIFLTPHCPLCLCQTQIEPERSFSETTTPRKP